MADRPIAIVAVLDPAVQGPIAADLRQRCADTPGITVVAAHPDLPKRLHDAYRVWITAEGLAADRRRPWQGLPPPYDCGIQVARGGQDLVVQFRHQETYQIRTLRLEWAWERIWDMIREYVCRIQDSGLPVLAWRHQIPALEAHYARYFAAYTPAQWAHRIAIEGILIPLEEVPEPWGHITRGLQATFYRQRGDAVVPTVLYFPGTGYTRLLEDTLMRESLKLAHQTGCHVWTVQYPLTPEVRYPEPLEAAWAAYTYLMRHASAWGLGPETCIFSGYSAGAMLAVQLAARVVRRGGVPPRSLLLVSPPLGPLASVPKAEPPGRFPELWSGVRAAQAVYFAAVHDPHDPEAFPLWMEPAVLQKLPKMFLFHLGQDYLLHQHHAWCATLAALEVIPDIVQIPAADHFSWWDHTPLWEAVRTWIRHTYPEIPP